MPLQIVNDPSVFPVLVVKKKPKPQLFTSLVWNTLAAFHKHPAAGCAPARPHTHTHTQCVELMHSVQVLGTDPVVTTWNAGSPLPAGAA